MTPDPAGLKSVDSSDPQSWNRYPYGRNDPIDITDPSGQDWFFSFMKWLVTIGSFVAEMPQVGIMFATSQAEAQAALHSVPVFLPPPQSSGPGNGQTAQPSSKPAQRPVYCDPHIMQAMLDAWNKQIAPNLMKQTQDESAESAFPAYATDGQGDYAAGNGPVDKPPQIQTGLATGFKVQYRPNAVAIFHTHPFGSGEPSTPSNHMGESGPGDTAAAVDSGKDIYVISDKGLSKASATGPRNPKYGKNNSPWIVQGNGVPDWLGKLKKNCPQ